MSEIKDRQYRMQALVLAVCYMDGWFNCLQSMGKIDMDDDYAICWVSMPNGEDIRVILVSHKRKTDFPEIPVCLVPRNKIQEDEWETMQELQIRRVDTN